MKIATLLKLHLMVIWKFTREKKIFFFFENGANSDSDWRMKVEK